MKFARALRLIATAAWLLLPAASRADDAPMPLRVIQGVATTPEGTPSAGTTLYLLDLPGSFLIPSLQGRGTVVTDSDGRFTWTIPQDLADKVPTTESKSHPPACYALPISGDWSVTLGIAHDYDADQARRDLLGQETQPCHTRWLQTGPDPFLAVTVPDAGTASVLVRGPDGQPVAGHAVQVVPLSSNGGYEGGVIYGGTTNAEGLLHLRLFPGLKQLLLAVPGVGFGSTGVVEVLPSVETMPQMPPLAPFGAISGAVAPGLITPGVRVRLNTDGPGAHKWYDPSSGIDATGRFALTDVLPGDHQVTLVNSTQPTQFLSLAVHPGEHVTGVVIEPQTTPEASSFFRDDPSRAQASTVAGHVTDPAGHPIPGVDVYVFCYPSWGFRQYRDALTAKTNSEGAYRVSGLPSDVRQLAVTVIAVDPGHPVAQSLAQAVPQPASSDPPSDFRADIVIPSRHSGLIVQALRNGKGVAGATVRLTPQTRNNNVFQNDDSPFDQVPRELFESFTQPTATTDANGEARFLDIAPGLWDVTAIAGDDKHMMEAVTEGTGNVPETTVFNISRGVVVEDGPPRRFSMALYAQPNTVALRPLGPSGQTPPKPTVGFEFSTPTFSIYPALPVDDRGISTYGFRQSGVWEAVARFRDTKQNGFPPKDEPCYEGRTLLAVSPALPQTAPHVIPAIRRGPGDVRVMLMDGSGRPASGAAYFGDPWDDARQGASLDPNGEAVFFGVPSGFYGIQADFRDPLASPLFGVGDQPFPSDRALTGRSLVVRQIAAVHSDQETAVTFRPQPVGYVRGKVIAPSPLTAYLIDAGYHYELPPAVRYDSKTGDYVAGPFLPGPAVIEVRSSNPNAVISPSSGEDFPVAIAAGQVVHLDLKVDPASINRAAPPVSGRVLMPDGKTPAWGAVAALVSPEELGGFVMAQADAAGQLHRTESSYPGYLPRHSPTDGPTGSILAVWLPGTSGVTVVSYDPGKENIIVLPAPVSLHGRVTVGGHGIAGLNGSFRVLAVYQGTGVLNDFRSVEAAAQADGSFELAGLTPGTYQIQASRDNVWLSRTVTLTVGSETPPDLTLDIAPPGVLVTLHVVDKTGQPLPNQIIALTRPAGPLAEKLWPKTLMTNAAGDLYLPGLEAGRHHVRIGDASSDKPVGFAVPPSRAGDAADHVVIVRRPD